MSLVDLDIGDEIQEAKDLDGADDDLLLRLTDSGWGYYLTSWAVCQYDSLGNNLGCTETSLYDYRHHEVYLYLEEDTERLRFIAKETAGAHYYAKILVD